MKFAIVVAAGGVGSRFGSVRPKQYQSVAGQPVIVHTLSRLLASDIVSSGAGRIVVAVSPQDQYWRRFKIFSDPCIKVVAGGDSRARSVWRGLQALAPDLESEDWVLVHDVARPCVTTTDIARLVCCLRDHPVGGLLAAPVADTIKRVTGEDHQVLATEDRSTLWSAFTPQMFRFGLLLDAMRAASAANWLPTDESAAIERMGFRPVLVEGRRDNIKLTRPEDLPLLEAILRQQKSVATGRNRQHQVQQQ